MKTVLVLSPHTDDGELAAGGTVAKWVSIGNEIHWVAFSSGEHDRERDIAARCECHNALDILGVKPNNRELLEFIDRGFWTMRQEILDIIRAKVKDIRPDVVLTPSSTDAHQDHNTIYNETIRACKTTCSIYGYEEPWNNITFNADMHVTLTSEHLQHKLDALAQYDSQRAYAYFNADFIKGWAAMRGRQVGREYAECFEVLRQII